MPTTLSIDSERRVAGFVMSGPVSGEEFVAFMTGALRRNPELADYDAVWDAIGYAGDISTDDMASVAMLMNDFRTDADGMARTALITLDGGFADWAQLMGHQFDRRRFCVFNSRAAGEAWLEGGQHGLDAA